MITPLPSTVPSVLSSWLWISLSQRAPHPLLREGWKLPAAQEKCETLGPQGLEVFNDSSSFHTIRTNIIPFSSTILSLLCFSAVMWLISFDFLFLRPLPVPPPCITDTELSDFSRWTQLPLIHLLSASQILSASFICCGLLLSFSWSLWFYAF